MKDSWLSRDGFTSRGGSSTVGKFSSGSSMCPPSLQLLTYQQHPSKEKLPKNLTVKRLIDYTVNGHICWTPEKIVGLHLKVCDILASNRDCKQNFQPVLEIEIAILKCPKNSQSVPPICPLTVDDVRAKRGRSSLFPLLSVDAFRFSALKVAE